MINPTKDELLQRGLELVNQFCAINRITAPGLCIVAPVDWPFGVCAYWRRSVTHICVEKCASIGVVGRQWSFPGYTVDRTPYGVLAHELGHHVDVLNSNRRGSYFGDFSVGLRLRAGEAPITSYCPNDAEWFAEMFRVFVTNPDLLMNLRPATYRELRHAGFVPVFTDTWRDRLAGAPARTIAAVERKLESL